MLLSEIVKILSCYVFACDNRLDIDIKFGCASDLMSDVLAFSQPDAVLLTGLVNSQTIHTAYISEIRAIVFVRGKKPTEDIVQLAESKSIPLLCTNYSMYEACGLLYKAGLESTMEFVPPNSSKKSFNSSF